MRTSFVLGCGLLLAALAAAPAAQAQQGLAVSSRNDEPSYQKEFTYGVNFNTRGGLIGGVSVRSTRVLNQDWSRFWSIEGVEIKHPKEQKELTRRYGGTTVVGKSNYFFALRPSVGLQRVVFRKAPESGVQVNVLASAGPSIGLLMPYYISYDYGITPGQSIAASDIRNEQYDPNIHNVPDRIVDRAPLFSGAGETKPLIGAHLRGALSFEYGRYRDAVAGVEVGFLLEAYTKDPVIIRVADTPDKDLNDQFLPSVYLTLYLGSRN
ncbi:hypothetical protein DNI29_02040 [Hymenobacter sediminis]|uniref:hypothetical protein n=1 Tax=Hymenobacter sediminis TaxID=2218621 RepID=UPI000F50F43E|nr:hypothetical protein [Hymenobacter sediminis]RPD49605.1 hypothetical protein DNI29_02040 [Hymenobacter sediminis]